MLLAYDYPLLEVFVTIGFFVLFLIWLFLLVLIVADLLRDRDADGLAKAVWLVFLILVPFAGVIAYVVVRGNGMAAREMERAKARNDALWWYVRGSSGMSGGALA